MKSFGRILTVLALMSLFAEPASPAAQKLEMPKVSLNVATLCDSASDDNGKLTIRGTFDQISGRKFPAQYSCSLAIRLTFTAEAYKGEHRIKILFLTADRKPFSKEVSAPLKKDKETDAALITSNVIVNFGGLEFPKPGTYFLQLWLDGRPLTTLHVHVQELADRGVV